MLALLLAALPGAHADGTWLLGIAGEAPEPALLAALDAAEADLSRCHGSSRVCVVAGPPDLDRRLAGAPGLRYVEADAPMVVGRPALPPPPSDADGTADCADPWELEQVRAPEAWALADGSGAPLVAVQDAGFRLTHVDLVQRVPWGYDYGDGDGTPEVEWDVAVPQHGTFIGCLIAGVPDNGLGRAGVAPYAKLDAQKIADSDGNLFYSTAVAAMDDLAGGGLGVRVLNYSLASSGGSAAFRDAVGALGEAGILVVAAAGNCATEHCADADNDANPLYPASYDFPHVVAVAGSTRDDALSPFSHYGAESVDLAAPGVDLCSCGVDSDQHFTTASGTSYAVPLVAGAAALVLEVHPDLEVLELARVLGASAWRSPELEGRVSTGARLDVAAALGTAVPRLPQPLDASVAGEGSLALQVANVGASGALTLVFSHGPELELLSVRDGLTNAAFELATYGPGEGVLLPGAGLFTVEEGRLSVATGLLLEHSAVPVVVGLRGRAEGEWPLGVRAVMASEAPEPLHSPHGEGEVDPTGFAAWSVAVEVSQAVPDSGDADSGDPDSESRDDDSGPAPKGGVCGCATGTGGGALAWLVALALLRRRRGA